MVIFKEICAFFKQKDSNLSEPPSWFFQFKNKSVNYIFEKKKLNLIARAAMTTLNQFYESLSNLTNSFSPPFTSINDKILLINLKSDLSVEEESFFSSLSCHPFSVFRATQRIFSTDLFCNIFIIMLQSSRGEAPSNNEKGENIILRLWKEFNIKKKNRKGCRKRDDSSPRKLG